MASLFLPLFLIVALLDYALAFVLAPTPFIRRVSWSQQSTRLRVREGFDDGKVSSVSEESFDWRNQWYPLAPTQDLDRDGPNKLTILGMDLAVWFHQPSGQWRAFADECPHRLVPLSEGRVESSGNLQCAYHGWEFNDTGACVRIPQLGAQGGSSDAPEVKIPRACATSFPVLERQGLIWVFPVADESKAAAAAKGPALIPALDDPTFLDATNFFVRDMPYSWEVLVENLCDPAHVMFTHHGMMNGANREKADKMDMVVTEETPGGFKARKDPYPVAGKYNVKFEAPCFLFYEIVGSGKKAAHEKKDAGKESDESKTYIGLGQYCIPTVPGRCRLIARFPFRLSIKPAMFMIRRTPRWITHLSQNIVLDSDAVFLSSQDERLDREEQRINPDYYMPAQCDAMVRAFRKWLGKHGKGGPTWMSVPAQRTGGEKVGLLRPMSVPLRGGRDALLDRYRQHTDICSSCRRAHRGMYNFRDVSIGAGVCLLAAAAGGVPRKKFVAGCGAIALLAPRLILRPLISRLECMPWPTQKWKASDKTT